MPDHTVVMRTLSDFTRHLLAPRDTQDALTALTRYATEILGLRGTGVSLARGGGLASPRSSRSGWPPWNRASRPTSRAPA